MVIDPGTLETVYWYSAIIGTIVFLVKTIFPVDTGAEVSTDFTSMADSDASFSIFTIEGISAFFMGFGFMGWYSFSQMHHELRTSLILAVITGIFSMLLFVWFISLARKLEHKAPYDVTTLLDKRGKAYVHFSPKGTGRIQIEFNSKLETLDAQNNGEAEIEAFAPIKVVKVENDIIYIEKE